MIVNTILSPILSRTVPGAWYVTPETRSNTSNMLVGYCCNVTAAAAAAAAAAEDYQLSSTSTRVPVRIIPVSHAVVFCIAACAYCRNKQQGMNTERFYVDFSVVYCRNFTSMMWLLARSSQRVSCRFCPVAVLLSSIPYSGRPWPKFRCCFHPICY